MKKFITLLLVLFIEQVCAQGPQKMSYQAVIRNPSNALITNTIVGMRISILQGSASGTAVYTETQNPTTNVNGLVSLEIGGGTVVTGTFSGINWAAGSFFVKTETDPSGGSNYTITGTTQLLSVPYALYAEKTGSTGNILLISGSSSAIDQNYQTLFQVDVKANKVVNLEGFINTTGSDVTVYIYNVTNSQWVSTVDCIYQESNVGFRYFNGNPNGNIMPFSSNNKRFDAKFIPNNDMRIQIQVKELTATAANGIGSASVVLSQ